MTSWRRLRTQAYLVLSVLLMLIVFLGAYALSEAERHAVEADELLTKNFRAMSLIKELESQRAEQLRAVAKFEVTRDSAYATLAERQREKIDESIAKLTMAIGNDELLGKLVPELKKLHSDRPDPGFIPQLRELERRLEQTRSEKLERIRVVASDLRKIILVTLVIAMGVTSWLAFLLYNSILKPLECLREAAKRIRDGELSYRVEKFGGFEELRELRREFNAMASKIEELDSMKSDFLSTVSHELKTPLTAVKEGLSLLTDKQGALPPHVQTRTLDICNQAVKRLETMIQNLLNHARMESGFYSFDERAKNFVSVVEQAVQGIRPIAERRKQVIEVDLKTDNYLAAFSSEGIVHAVENLLFNAVKYGDNAHPIKVKVSRIDAKPVPQLEVRVTNRGKGLLPAELKQVFERFFRAANADGQKGVGLGLSVVKRIIEAHHGEVAAESDNGVTSFYFRIPQRYESKALALTAAQTANTMTEATA